MGAMNTLLLLALMIQVIEEPRAIHSVQAGDVNGDGWMDLVTQNAAGYAVYLNRKALRFELAHRIEKIGVGEPGGYALTDVNADGRLDLVSGSHDSYRIAVLLGNGKGDFSPVEGSPFVPRKNGKPHNHRIAVADINGDGHRDILAANIGDGDIEILVGDGKGGFARGANSPFIIGLGAYAIEVRDVNLDRIPDLIVASTHDSGPEMLVALGEGGGRFKKVEQPDSKRKFRIGNLQLTDWDRDGKLDAIVGPGENDRPNVLLGDGKGQFQRAANALPGGARTWQFAVIEEGIVAAANDSIQLISRSNVRTIPVPKSTWYLAIADFDNDGKLDIASVATEAGTIQISKMP